MLRNTKKCVPIFTFATMLSSYGPNTLVTGIRSKLDLDTDLFSGSFFDDDDSFFSSDRKKKGRGGFGFVDDSFMDTDFMGTNADDGNTQYASSSSSTSYSTMTGPDGQVYQQASQQGEQKVC